MHFAMNAWGVLMFDIWRCMMLWDADAVIVGMQGAV